MTIAIVTDLHFGCRGDSRVFYRLQEDWYNTNFFPYLETNGIKTVAILGDVFDRRKMVNFETLHRAKAMFFDRLQASGIEVFIITGNHDVFFKNTNSLNSLQQLLTIYDNITLISEPTDGVMIDGMSCLMLPWINSENYDATVEAIQQSSSKIVMSHLELSGFEYHRGMMSEHGHLDVDILHKFDFVLSGHYHHRSSKGNIHYLGTPYELTWADYGDPKGFHLFDGKSLDFVENGQESSFFTIVAYDDSDKADIQRQVKEGFACLEDRFVKLIITHREHNKLFEKFEDAVCESGLADLIVIDQTSALVAPEDEDAVAAPSDTLGFVHHYIDYSVDTDLSKQKLKSMMRDLYMAALAETGVE